MNSTAAWFVIKAGEIGMSMVLWYAQKMEEAIPGGMPRGRIDAVANLLTTHLGAESCAIVTAKTGGWCPCGQGPAHKEIELTLNSFNFSDSEMASHFTHVTAALEKRLQVSREHQHAAGAKPRFDA